MNDAIAVQRSRRLAGLELGGAIDALPNIVALLESSSVEMGDYVRLLEATAVNDEIGAMAGLLFSGALELTSGRNAYQSEDQIELWRDEVKTVLLVNVPRMGSSNCVVSGQVGRQIVRARLDVLPNDACFLFLGKGSMKLRLLSVDPDSQGEQLVEHGVNQFSTGQVMRLRRDIDAFDTLEVSGDVWLLQVVVNDHSDLVYHYDRSTLRRIGASSSNFHATRMEFVMDILWRLPVDGAVAMLSSEYRSSRFYFVRWKAVQTLLLLDLVQAKPVLECAANDVHPQVRSAANRTLSNLRRHGHI